VEWNDAVPLITPTQLRRIHLFGIPLVSAIKNPLTGRPDAMDDDLLKEYITEAVGLVEMEGGFDIFPRQYQERAAYDAAEQHSFGFMKVRHRPAFSVEELSIADAAGTNVYEVNIDWVEKGLLHQGQINVVPFAMSAQGGGILPLTSLSGNVGLLPAPFRSHWVPSLWQIKYTSGWTAGALPRVVNQLIGTAAAMEVLSMLATTYARNNSSSLSIDGLSQSTSTPGPNLFDPRLKMLADKRKFLVKKLQRAMGLGFFSDNV